MAIMCQMSIYLNTLFKQMCVNLTALATHTAPAALVCENVPFQIRPHVINLRSDSTLPETSHQKEFVLIEETSAGRIFNFNRSHVTFPHRV